ncbi:MAG: baseplate J/gp47 family protein [Anaerolineaceae bacterium]|nr:baseplate J/gp47 family protein [Anaerolineaceae bacterium]
MKTTVLQLESYDSRQSILDKLARVSSGRILLVWPKRNKIDLSEVDLVLLNRAADEKSTPLALVSHSPLVIDQAHAHVINCFASIPAAERSVWAKAREDSRHKPQSTHDFDLSKPMVKKPIPSEISKKVFSWSAAILSGLALLALLVYLFPSVTVILSPQKNEKTIQMQIWGSKKFTSVNVNGNLPLLQKKVEVSSSKTVAASGKVAIPNAFASAVVQFTNLTSQELIIPAGTTVSTGEEPIQRFTTQEEITLGTGTDSTASVAVRASTPGSSANVPAGAIQLVEGSLGGWVEVTNPEAASGGLDSEAPSPSEDDYAAARADLLKEIKTLAVVKFAEETGFYVIQDSLAIGNVVEETRSIEVGQPGDQGTLTLSVEVIGLGYFQSDLQTLAMQSLQASLGENEVFYGATPTVSDPKSLQSDGEGGYKWSADASTEVGPRIDPIQVAQTIAGLRYDEASRQLETAFLLEKTPEYRSFASPFQIPWAPFRINVEVQ